MLGDNGYQGAQGVLTPYKGRGKPARQKTANRAHARLRRRGERAFSQIKTWKATLLPVQGRVDRAGDPRAS
ncbi:transposase family protein [Nocardia salmonicida]|uniref:transposase family protein n=1 Tax=Nocardia salmonicida TaxID=53431 RepID=UPI00344126EA